MNRLCGTKYPRSASGTILVMVTCIWFITLKNHKIIVVVNRWRSKMVKISFGSHKSNPFWEEYFLPPYGRKFIAPISTALTYGSSLVCKYKSKYLIGIRRSYLFAYLWKIYICTVVTLEVLPCGCILNLLSNWCLQLVQ